MDSVKIDSGLLKEIEVFLEKKENKIKYVSKKHFVDVAVLEFLKRERTINQDKLNYKKKEKRDGKRGRNS